MVSLIFYIIYTRSKDLEVFSNIVSKAKNYKKLDNTCVAVIKIHIRLELTTTVVHFNK